MGGTPAGKAEIIGPGENAETDGSVGAGAETP